MAGPYYVRSTDGNNADDGLSWATAKATLAGALAVAAAGERIYVSQAHAETQASAITLTSAGTVAAPVEIICVNDAAEPPTALATTATITSTGNSNISIGGSALIYGITFNCGTGAVSPVFGLLTSGTTSVPAVLTLDTCMLAVLATGASGAIQPGQAGGLTSQRLIVLKDVTVKLSATSQFVHLGNAGQVRWEGGSYDGSVAVPTSLFDASGAVNGQLRVLGVDLSALGSGKNLIDPTSAAPGFQASFENCKLGSGVTLAAAAMNGPGTVIRMDNCDSADTQYRMQRSRYEGDVYSETTVVRTNGASSGITPLSHKMTSSASRTLSTPLYGPEIVKWNAATGSPKTVSVEIIHDSLTKLKDDEVWLEVEYLGTSGFPKSSFANNRKASVLAAAADQAVSTVAWTTTGLTNPNKQKLSVTLTPQEIGVLRARIGLAKSAYTIYVDPLLQVA